MGKLKASFYVMKLKSKTKKKGNFVKLDILFETVKVKKVHQSTSKRPINNYKVVPKVS